MDHIGQADHIIISTSGGKDSSVLMQWAIENCLREKLICVHAIIDIDWHETLPIVEAQCKHFDLPLVKVQSVDKHGNDKGFLSQLTSPRIDRKTKEIKEYQFPDINNRWCTAMLKTGPIDKYARTLKGNVVTLIGERREESPNESGHRYKLEAWRPDLKNTLKNGTRTIVKASPLLELLEVDVWNIIKEENIPIHPCYALGVGRASCAICIFSSDKEIAIAAKHAPDIVGRYLEAEKKIKHTFKYKPATKKRSAIKQTIADILKEQGIDNLKMIIKKKENFFTGTLYNHGKFISSSGHENVKNLMESFYKNCKKMFSDQEIKIISEIKT